MRYYLKEKRKKTGRTFARRCAIASLFIYGFPIALGIKAWNMYRSLPEIDAEWDFKRMIRYHEQKEKPKQKPAPESLPLEEILDDWMMGKPLELCDETTNINGLGILEKTIKGYKSALKEKESSSKIWKFNRISGAAGYYQFLPSTALGLIKRARKEGIEMPYKGPIDRDSISLALRTDPKLNEALINYDISKKRKIFGNNPDLWAMAHYTNQDDILKSLKLVYPDLTDYSDVDVLEFANARANGLQIIGRNIEGTAVAMYDKNTNPWLIKKQGKNPSILEYALSIKELMEEYAKKAA